MPVDTSYITPLASDPSTVNLYQAFTTFAQFMNSLENAVGVNAGSKTSVQSAAAPKQASWKITAAGNGHFVIQITNPSGTAPIQHQIASATDQSFDANSNSTMFTLGFGQTTLDIVDPHVTKYFRIQSRTAGSAWNSWLIYANASGVVSLASGALTV
jgi:hypothetical protein